MRGVSSPFDNLLMTADTSGLTPTRERKFYAGRWTRADLRVATAVDRTLTLDPAE